MSIPIWIIVRPAVRVINAACRDRVVRSGVKCAVGERARWDSQVGDGKFVCLRRRPSDRCWAAAVSCWIFGARRAPPRTSKWVSARVGAQSGAGGGHRGASSPVRRQKWERGTGRPRWPPSVRDPGRYRRPLSGPAARPPRFRSIRARPCPPRAWTRAVSRNFGTRCRGDVREVRLCAAVPSGNGNRKSGPF